MDHKYFMHRIQLESGSFSKGIEIHDTLDSAILAFWGRMKLAYDASAITFMSCKITDIDGNVIAPYDMTWKADGVTIEVLFLHHIRLDGDRYTKDIDICNTFNAARASFAAHMEYGYYNPNHSSVELVDCMITDAGGAIMKPYDKNWRIPDPEPEPPTPDPEQQQ